MSPASSAQVAELVANAARLGVELGADQVQALYAFLERLYRWNRSAALTRVAEKDAVRLHLLDSLSLLPLVADCPTLADLGSGAGLPGLVVAVAGRQRRVTLVESRRRKCSFLAEVVGMLGLREVEICHGDARDLAARGRRFDAVVSRAFLPPLKLAPVAKPLLAPGGRLVLMCGGEAKGLDAELQGAMAPLAWREEKALTLPGGSERRRLLVFERSRS